jgi:translocation and assembly module TamB
MSASSASAALPPRRWPRRLALTVLALAVLLLGAASWLLGTTSGLRFALAQAQGLSHDAFSVQQARGRLGGPMDLAGLRYDDGKGTVVDVAQMHLQLRLWPLLHRRLHVLALAAEAVRVALPAPSPSSTGHSAWWPQPPMAMVFDHAHVGALKVTSAGHTLFAANRLDLAGRWSDDGVQLQQLVLRAPDGHVDLAGPLAIGARYRGNSRASFAWKLGSTQVAGRLVVHGDGNLAHLDLTLSQPTVARLQLDLGQQANHIWTAKLDVPRFDATSLPGAGSLKTLAIAVRGRGTRRSGTIQGRVDLNDSSVLLQPLQASLSDDLKTLTLQELTLRSPQISGNVSASGVVQLDARPLRAALDVRWQHVVVPATLAGQTLASRGGVKVNGSAAQWHADGNMAIGPPGRLAPLVLHLDGTAQQITLRRLDWTQAHGSLRARGSVTLQPALAWQLQATAHRFDPGQVFAGWGGALDGDITSAGAATPSGPDATLAIRQLGGTLRGRPVRGEGRLHLATGAVLDGQLVLSSGGSRVTLKAPSGNNNHIELTLAMASLGDWLPNASGRLDGHFIIGGKPPKLSVNGSLQGHALVWQQQQMNTLQLIAGLPDLSHPAGKLDLRATGVRLQGLTFQQLHLLAEGSQRDHRLTLDARGRQLSGGLMMHGALQGARWTGTLTRLNVDPQGLPGWHLQHPAPLSYRGGAASLGELCLSAGDPQLCVSAKRDAPGNLDARFRLHALPLALLLNAAGEANLPLRADGTLEGSGALRRNAAGTLSGSAAITSAHGTLTDTDHADRPLLVWHDLSAHADLGPARQQLSVRADLDKSGRLDGHFEVTGAQQALSGQLALSLDNLAPLELFTTELASVKGRLNGNVQFGGTLRQPAITGQAQVEGFAAELPTAGLKLHHGRLSVSTGDAQLLHIAGSVQSGQGTLAINGSSLLGAHAQTTLTLKGSRFTAVDLPAARVVVSPDLTVKRDASGIDVGGALTLDSAAVNLDKLPGSGAVHASPDVVVIDQKQQQRANRTVPVSSRVVVDLGRNTHVIGKSLDGHLSGVLTVNDQPGRAVTGQGQLTVDGSYKAYGQTLHIERGQLLFASTPLDNPGLNIRATRKLNPNATVDEGQQVGLLISGTAQRPILTVFSNPVMAQSDALSYLVTGKPLAQVKGGEGDLVSAAAQTLGSAAGNLLAKRIGARLGVDDIGVSSSAALNGSSAFSVGKYLSPRLYLSYGVGLFEHGQVITLRYRLSQRWNFEAQNATDYNRASLNYRIEK